MEHKKVVHVKATIKPRETTKPESNMAPITRPMFINTEYVTIYIGVRSIEQSYQFELATDNAERHLYEEFGRSDIDIRADMTHILPNYGRDIVMKVPIKYLPILLEEYAKKYYHFEYDVVFDYSASADINDKDKDQYATVARIDRRIVGEEAFKMFTKIYIGEDTAIKRHNEFMWWTKVN